MTPMLAEIHNRSKQFHASIARKAATVRPPPVMPSFSIPNTPFGIPKIGPPRPVIPNPQADYYHTMWFYELVAFNSRPPEVFMGDTIRVESVQRAVALNYNVSKVDILSNRRMAEMVRPRQVAMFLSRVMTTRTLPEIGRRFGGRDHTTVLHAVRKIERLIKGDQVLADRIEEIKAGLLA